MPKPGPEHPREIELKLECEPEAVERLKAHPFFARQAGEARRLRNTYFDTPRFALRAAGIALRIREDGDRLIQTVKVDRRQSGLAFDRTEWEIEVGAVAPDFLTTLPDSIRKQLGAKTVRKLKPAFEVRTDRAFAIVEHAGAQIELALDSARIAAETEEVAFSEVELERRSGDVKALFTLALELSDSIPLRLSARTKSDRGYALLDPEPPQAVKAKPILLDPSQGTASAIQIVCASCLRQVVENEAIVRERANPDAIHQARVGVRRLRAALSLFKDIVADNEVAAIQGELRWIGEQLGKARDLDVFISKTLEPAVRDSDHPDAGRVLVKFRQKRDRAYRGAIKALNSDRYRRAVLSTAAWIEAGPWIRHATEGASDPRNTPVRQFACSEMERRWRKTRVRLKGVEKLDEEARHRVRIEMKKIRYAAEFFGSVFREGKERQFGRAAKILEGIQATLGDLNDIAVSRTMAGAAIPEIAADGRDKEIPALLKQARAQSKQFRSVEAFWTTD